MEYVTYVLIILGLMVLCLLVFRRTVDFGRAQSSRPVDAVSVSTYPRGKQADGMPTAGQKLDVPTPWGWPGSAPGVGAADERTVSDALHRFVDHLIAEKQTVESSEYLLKRNESLRVLIEERYGKSRDAENGSAGAKTRAAASKGQSVFTEHRQLKEVRTPWGW